MVRPLAFLALVLTAACAGTDEETTHAGAICHRIFELCPDGNGWESEDVCEDGYLGDAGAWLQRLGKVEGLPGLRLPLP